MKKTISSGEGAANGDQLPSLRALPGSGEWLGACDWCGTEKPMGNGQAKVGRKYIRVLLFCDQCHTRTVHKFHLPSAKLEQT
jgi:hypothetical protein